MFLNNTRYERANYLSQVFENDNPKLPRKGEVSSHYEGKEAHIDFVTKVEEYLHFFIKQLRQLSTVCKRFNQKTTLKLFRKCKYTLLLKALTDEDFDHELKLEIKLKTLTNIADENKLE